MNCWPRGRVALIVSDGHLKYGGPDTGRTENGERGMEAGKK